jgi:hypothetical protein
LLPWNRTTACTSHYIYINMVFRRTLRISESNGYLLVVNRVCVVSTQEDGGFVMKRRYNEKSEPYETDSATRESYRRRIKFSKTKLLHGYGSSIACFETQFSHAEYKIGHVTCIRIVLSCCYNICFCMKSIFSDEEVFPPTKQFYKKNGITKVSLPFIGTSTIRPYAYSADNQVTVVRETNTCRKRFIWLFNDTVSRLYSSLRC